MSDYDWYYRRYRELIAGCSADSCFPLSSVCIERHEVARSEAEERARVAAAQSDSEDDMTDQSELFDRDESHRLKSEGMERAAEARPTELEIARDIARRLGEMHGEVHADMVGQKLFAIHGIKSLGPAAGALFKTPEWHWTGQFHKSERKKNHSRLLRVWRYQPVQAS